jgi:prophage antirepressor-like protein
MSDLSLTFEGKAVRTVGQFKTKDGTDAEMGWVLADVATVLSMSHARELARSLDEDEKGVSIVDTPGGPQEVQVITEPGLYKVLARSRKPESKRFDRWVRHEVLPTIRKTGGYGITPQHGSDLATLVGDAVTNSLRPILKPIEDRLDALERPQWHQVCEAFDITPFDCWLKVTTVNKPPVQSGLYEISSNGRVIYIGMADGKRGLFGRLDPQKHEAMRYLWHQKQSYTVRVCPTDFGGNTLKNVERNLQAAIQPDWEYGGIQVQWSRIKNALFEGQMNLF